MTFEQQIKLIDLIIKIVGGLVAGVAFLLGYYQYKKGQNWQKAQVILNLIDSFEKDPMIENACQMLDWDQREVQVGTEKKIRFRNEMLLSALRVPVMDTAKGGMDITRTGSEEAGTSLCSFTEEESLIRDCFDAFFDFFHKLYRFWRNGLLDFQDLAYFFYWFELVRNVGTYKKDPKIQEKIFDYIKKYKFVGVKELLDEYGKNPDPLLLADETPDEDKATIR